MLDESCLVLLGDSDAQQKVEQADGTAIDRMPSPKSLSWHMPLAHKRLLSIIALGRHGNCGHFDQGVVKPPAKVDLIFAGGVVGAQEASARASEGSASDNEGAWNPRHKNQSLLLHMQQMQGTFKGFETLRRIADEPDTHSRRLLCRFTGERKFPTRASRVVSPELKLEARWVQEEPHTCTMISYVLFSTLLFMQHPGPGRQRLRMALLQGISRWFP
ncbi:hypothetical protein CLCR_06300 [Cladophialophora carrionii]|uniref:Uncharacterized protein n=1 Tax=Cladophialophora carrionii TaxID=86049 RepID=A0A1C1C929_9EURO|nr:hypothetical protein CLCR_06300 [Cladophialophora carrionii]